MEMEVLTDTVDNPTAAAASAADAASPAAGAPQETPDLPVTVIERRPGWKFVDLAELWRYRELLYFLVWRDVKVRYKQTILGAAWAILQPLATMVVFTIFFGRLAGISTDVPYPLFAFAALLPWTFFSNAISQAGGSVVGNQNLVTKVYFPRLFIPLGAIGAGVVDLAIAFGMLVVLMLYYGVAPGVSILLVPLLALGLVVATLGVGVMLAALTVAYRDFRYVVPFAVQLWMFATPCIYMQPETVLGERTLALLPLNPAFGLITNFRAATLNMPLDLYSLGVSLAVSFGLLIIGCLYFRRVEATFADII